MVSVDLGAQVELPPTSPLHRFGYIRWRYSQFKSPAQTYRYRARVEPASTAAAVSGPAASSSTTTRRRHSLPPQPHSFPSHPTPTTTPHCGSTITRCPHLDTPPQRFDQRQAAALATPAAPKPPFRSEAMVLQPRAPQKHPSSVPTRSRIQTLQQPFDYVDPTHLKGNISFDVRLVELGRLEQETVRWEEQRRLRAATSLHCSPIHHQPSTGGRPSSAKARLTPSHAWNKRPSTEDTKRIGTPVETTRSGSQGSRRESPSHCRLATKGSTPVPSEETGPQVDSGMCSPENSTTSTLCLTSPTHQPSPPPPPPPVLKRSQQKSIHTSSSTSHLSTAGRPTSSHRHSLTRSISSSSLHSTKKRPLKQKHTS